MIWFLKSRPKLTPKLLRPRVGFEAVLHALSLPKRPRILDVGAGGFLGQNTTRYLLAYPGARVDAVELDPDRAKALADKFGAQLRVINADFLAHPFEERYDLIVLDLDSQIIPDLFETWIPGKVKSLLKPSGAVITLCFGYAPDQPTESYGLAEEVQVLAKDFLQRFFGTTIADEAAIRRRYERDGDYRVVAVRGKLGNPPPETIIWIGLAKA